MPRPCTPNDRVTVTVTAREKRAEGRMVIFDCNCVNQDGENVLTGTATVVAPAQKLRRPAIELAELHLQDHDHYEMLISAARRIPPINCAVAHPCEESALQGAVEAANEGIIVPILVGPKAKILDTAAKARHRYLRLRAGRRGTATPRRRRRSSSSAPAGPSC